MLFRKPYKRFASRVIIPNNPFSIAFLLFFTHFLTFFYCFAIIPLLFFYCFSVVFLLLFCCFSVVFLLLFYCFSIVFLMFLYCFSVANSFLIVEKRSTFLMSWCKKCPLKAFSYLFLLNVFLSFSLKCFPIFFS